MVKFTRNALASLGALVAVSATSPAYAGPLIIATNVSSICKVEEDNTVSTVSLTLNTVTANFYGSGLYYHFIPASGATLSFPSPSGDPKRFVVPAGTYNLQLTTSATYPDPAASTSQFYSITVAAPKVLTMRNGRKFCAAIRLQGGTKAGTLKKD